MPNINKKKEPKMPIIVAMIPPPRPGPIYAYNGLIKNKVKYIIFTKVFFI